MITIRHRDPCCFRKKFPMDMQRKWYPIGICTDSSSCLWNTNTDKLGLWWQLLNLRWSVLTNDDDFVHSVCISSTVFHSTTDSARFSPSHLRSVSDSSVEQIHVEQIRIPSVVLELLLPSGWCSSSLEMIMFVEAASWFSRIGWDLPKIRWSSTSTSSLRDPLPRSDHLDNRWRRIVLSWLQCYPISECQFELESKIFLPFSECWFQLASKLLSRNRFLSQWKISTCCAHRQFLASPKPRNPHQTRWQVPKATVTSCWTFWKKAPTQRNVSKN